MHCRIIFDESTNDEVHMDVFKVEVDHGVAARQNAVGAGVSPESRRSWDEHAQKTTMIRLCLDL